MSYDLQVWSIAPVELAAALPDATRWRFEDGLAVWSGSGWQLVVGPEHRVDFADVPEAVHAEVPGIQHVIELSLEPTNAPRAAYALLRRVAKALAAAGRGAVVDPQTDTLTTPAGARRFVAPRRGRVLAALQLSWFSAEPSVRSRAWLERLVDCLHVGLPEALPVRYGECEQPAYRFRETGREHLIDFLAEEHLAPGRSGVSVWSPNRPVLDLSLSLHAGPSRFGWQSHRLTMTIEAAALDQHGWAVTLRRLWRRIAHLMHAFYADVRTLRDYRPDGATTVEILAADRHPACAFFWAGIPRDGGHAVALGKPYLAMWPEFVAAGEHDDGIVFMFGDDWRDSTENVFHRVGGVPEGLVMQCSGYANGRLGPNLSRIYPPVWPFGITHGDSRS